MRAYMSAGTLTSMTRPRIFAALALALLAPLVAACGAPEGGRDDDPGPASGKADELDTDTEGEAGDLAHRDAVITCEELATRLLDRTNEARVEELVQTERNRQNCLVGANDAVVDVVDNALTNLDSSEAGRTESRFDSHRSSVQDLCNSLVEGSEGALDKSGALLSQRCTADGERQLADLVDAFVALGRDAIAIPESRNLYPDCYDAFDSAGETALGHAAEVTALQDLSACIVQGNDAARLRLIDNIVASFPGREPGDLEDETYAYFRGWHDAQENLCGILSQAGEATDEAFVERARAECLVAGDAMLGELSASVVADLFDGAAAGSDDGGSDSGGSSSGGPDSGGSTGSGG